MGPRDAEQTACRSRLALRVTRHTPRASSLLCFFGELVIRDRARDIEGADDADE